MIKKLISKTYVIIVISLFSSIVLMLGCEKEANIIEKNRSEKEIIKLVLEKSEFIKVNINLNRIIELSKIKNELVVNFISVKSSTKEVNSVSKANTFLKSIGIVNADKILELCNNNYELIQKIIFGIPEIKNMHPVEKTDLFNKIFLEYDRINKQTYVMKSMDICSSGYANGMDACSRQLALELGTSAVAGAAGMAAGTPLAGGIIYFGGIALAYLHESSCQQDVKNTWSACRAENPIN